MRSLPPSDRLTDEEMHYVRPGDSADVQAWNGQYSFLVDEYRTALAERDEGWISDSVAEVRKCLGGLERADSHLAELTQHTRLDGQQRRCHAR